MKRYVLTTFEHTSRAKSKSYEDVSAAVKDWMEFSDRHDGDFFDWRDALLETGHLTYISYSDEFMDKCAFVTVVEIY